MGAIGYIMTGSGLKELLSIIYAPNTVEKMFTGHAYARAVRGHGLVHLALSKIILKLIEINDTEKGQIIDILKNFSSEPPLLDEISNETNMTQLSEKLKIQLHKLEKNGATSRLWVQYFHMVCLMKEFIMAERMGDWNLHIQCIQKMLPFFHASEHFPYAKACQLYLNDMANLKIR